MGDRETFSQRNGYAAAPPQLILGEISKELRALLWYAAHTDLNLCVGSSYNGSYVQGRWLNILKDHHVRVRHRMADEFSTGAYQHENLFRKIFELGSLPVVFDTVEFLLQHAECSGSLRTGLTSALADARAAYRILDGRHVVAVGNEQQADALERAVKDASQSAAQGAARHLVAAGHKLRTGDWAGSVRESIHAVESVAVQLAPSKDTLGDALAVLDRRGHIHGSLKSAFQTLYGYASNEEGVRHALVFKDEANVDESDALFMLGACASFVSYLVRRAGAEADAAPTGG